MQKAPKEVSAHSWAVLGQGALIAELQSRYGVTLDYEAILERNYRRYLQAGDFVADVGAHSGRHTRCFLEAIGQHGRLAAFEPLEYFCTKLSAEMANSPNVSVYNVALSKDAGRATFFAALGTPEESGLQKKDYIYPDRANVIEIEVIVDRLDHLLGDWNRLDYLKLDIEGAELDCLDGGSQTVRRTRPLISFECGIGGYGKYGKTSQDFMRFALEEGYEIFDLFGNDLMTDGIFYSIVDRAGLWDFYFVPKEKKDRFTAAIYQHALCPL